MPAQASMLLTEKRIVTSSCESHLYCGWWNQLSCKSRCFVWGFFSEAAFLKSCLWVSRCVPMKCRHSAVSVLQETKSQNEWSNWLATVMCPFCFRSMKAPLTQILQSCQFSYTVDMRTWVSVMRISCMYQQCRGQQKGTFLMWRRGPGEESIYSVKS